MHTMRRNDNRWTVGFSAGNGQWYALQDFADMTVAARVVSWLNGGEDQGIRLG